MKANTKLSMPSFPEASASLLKKHLTDGIWSRLAGQSTASGYSFQQAIRSGVENPDSGIGVYAGDEESYQLFAPLLNLIIEDYHGSAGPHPETDFSLDSLPEVSLAAQSRVKSTRIRVGRNLSGFPLGAAISREQRFAVEKLICEALDNLPASIGGEYYSVSSMSPKQNKDLIARHLLYKNEDRFMASANLMRDWPEGRGLFLSSDESFSAWVNEEDQLRIIAMQQGGDVKAVFALLAEAVAALSKTLSFLFSNELGYLASCPTNLGTSMRASVHMMLPVLAQDEANLHKQADALDLQVRGQDGEHSASTDSIYDISNRMRLGVTEAAAVGHLIRGINRLAELDKNDYSGS